jgi:tetratricopeptide (TPR) repeat protein
MLSITLPLILALGISQGLPGAQARPAGDDQLASAHYRAGWGHMAVESWEEAAREFQAAIDINPQFKLAYYGLGRAKMSLKRFTEAARAYEACRDIYVSQASHNFSSKSDAERMMADDIMQIDMALARLSAGPQTPQTQIQVAQMQMNKQRLQNRTRGMDSMSITTPVPPFVTLALGSAYFRAERFADAEREYRATIEADPKFGEAHNNLAVVYLETGRIRDAETEVKLAEKAGFKVNPRLKDDIKSRKGGA